jgi:hypothetical protein
MAGGAGSELVRKKEGFRTEGTEEERRVHGEFQPKSKRHAD